MRNSKIARLAEPTAATSRSADHWISYPILDLEDPLAARVEVEGDRTHHKISIVIVGAVPVLEVAIDAAQAALEAYADAIAQAAQEVV
ncbi:hypothetical protein ACQ4M4_25875 [Leptolyngbya sp. AN02str]|uniref:hypothetical protein n=1 Tax=Leptolyngbya sp. AN02str TaxID=3423363 RepID=UPI003D310D07